MEIEAKLLKEEKCQNLQGLFTCWQEEHKSDIDRLRIGIKELNEKEKCCFSSNNFKILLESYGIPAGFSNFFRENDREEKCKYVLENAFNLDGGKRKFEPPVGGGYEYIFLFKEANDSEKINSNDKNKYPVFENELKKGNVNPWIYDWPEKKFRSGIPCKLPKAFEKYCEITISEKPGGFLDHAGYMNINKRGGESRADEKAILNYAKYYRNYILKEIELLGGSQENVNIFVCGSKDYFRKLMKNLGLDNEKDDKAKYCFINITHPSARISYENLVKQMRLEQFNPKLKKEEPVYVSKFECK